MEGSRQDILKGLSLIQELAIQLRVSKECLATSNFYFQKYKVLCGIKSKSYLLAGACVFLACKVLEQPRRTELLCSKLYQVRMSRKRKLTPNLLIPPISVTMLSGLKEKIHYYEFLLLDEIGFRTVVKLPFNKIEKIVDELSILGDRKGSFLRLAFGFATDYYRTSIPLVRDVGKIAEVCVYFAAQRFRVDVGFLPDEEIVSVLSFAVKIDCMNKIP